MRKKKEILGGFDDKKRTTLEFCELEAFLDIRDLLESILSEIEQKNRSQGILKRR